MAIFQGSGVALVTPMNDDFKVDYDAMAGLIEFHIENGTDALIIAGTTGESSTLTEEEHSQVIAFATKQVAGRVPVVAGTGSNDTRTAVKLSKQAEADGADAVLCVTPYYNKATQAGLKDYFTQIAEAISIPVILYNVPSRTGVNIEPETAVELAETVDNIVAIKEASGDISQAAKLMSIGKGKIDMYSGNDDQIIPLMSLGGIGVISVIANVIPKETHDMTQAYLDGDIDKARDLQLGMINLCDALFIEVNPIPVVKAMELMGKAKGVLRSPLTEIAPEHEAVLRKAMEDYGVL